MKKSHKCLLALLAVLGSAAIAQQARILDFGNDFLLNWENAFSNSVTTVEFATELPTDQFTPALNVLSTGSTSQAVIPVPEAGRAFYRLNAMDASGTPEGMGIVLDGWYRMGPVTAATERVVFVDGFLVDHHEVSKASWDAVRLWAVMNGYSFTHEGQSLDAGKEIHPVQTINWYDAVKWCNARSEKEGLVPTYYTSSSTAVVYRTGELDLSSDAVRWDASGYRLPTEAEWEKAARGGLDGQPFPWGPVLAMNNANFFNSLDPFNNDTTPVGDYAPNGYGLHDVAGNVGEWVWDWFQVQPPPSLSINPAGPALGTERLTRGGSWQSGASDLRCADRSRRFVPEDTFTGLGFRTLRKLPAILSEIPPSVSLSVDNATIAEAGGVATFTATLDAVSALDVTVNLTVSGSATGGGVDYTFVNASILIPAGSLSGSATVTADQDLLEEVDETVVVDIASVVNGTESGTQQLGTTILDDDTTQDEFFAQMQAVVDWGVSASNAYEDAQLTVQVSDGSAVEAFKGFGNDMPDLSNLYLVSPDFVVEDLWFGHEGVKSRYWDKGAYDHFLNIHNTIHISYETDPGQVSGLSGDTDQVYMFRLWHGTFWEAVGLGLKWMGDNTFVFYGQNGEAFTSAPVNPNFGTDYMLRLTYKVSDLSIKVYLNGEEIISGNLVAPRDIREFAIGTNSHPLAQHFRFYGLKRGEFTDAELATLENNSNRLWPRGQKPSFPYIDGIGSGVYTDFDSETNAWTLPAGERINFVGGSGEPGVHLYQWYYWNPDLAAGDGVGPLDRHRPLVGATTVKVDRDDYKAAGEPFNGHEGDAFNRVFCVITPVDSEGVQGVSIRSSIWYDNIQ